MPELSIVIPCFNYGRFVHTAVGSALNQKGVDLEVILVDDGSTDTATIRACDACAGPRVRVIHQANTGLPGARNTGAREARADLIGFLDADDWLLPNFARSMTRAIRDEQSNSDDVSHAYGFQTMAELGHGTWRAPEWDPLLMLITNIHPPTCVVVRDKFEAVGGFCEDMREGYEDWDLWISFVEKGWRGVRVPEPVYIWRRHSFDTMIFGAVQNHDALYAKIIERHKSLFDERAMDIARACNSMMRQWDVNWIDEERYPIPLRYLKRAHDENESHQQAIRDSYESMLALKAHHALHRFIRRLPAPLATAALHAATAAKRFAPG